MKIYILLGLCFITGFAVKMADSRIIPVSLISGIVKLSSSFLNIINGLNERNDVYDSINKLSTKISSTNEMLYQKLVIHSQWNKIEETRLEIQSSLLDLKRCLTASTSERLKYRNLFIKRADKAISRVRFLASHLIDVVPGNSKSLLAMATEASRCNASGIDVMQAETMDLLSNGILVEMSLMRILDNFTLEQETLFWEHEINRVLSHFLSQHDACLLRQRSLVLEDLVSSVSASRLQNDNRKRYQWDWNDVFQIPKQIPKPFRHYIIDSDNVFITQGDATIKIITYGGSRKSHPYFAKSDLEKLVDSVIPGKDDAEDIATKVRTALMHTGVRFSAIIVFFNGQGIQPDIAIDTDTPALYVYTERSTYTYCMSTFCDINWDDWLGVNDRVSGYFTVYAVLDPTVYPVLDPILKAIGSAPWVDVPCTWIARDSLNRHQRTETHSQAKLLEANRLAPRNLVGQLEEMGCLQKSARIAAFKNLYWLMKQEIPHTTNYLPLNDLVKLQGCSILANMNQGQNNKGESQRFVQEAVLAMGNIIRQDILTQAIDSPWYTIMVDETTDISVISEMTVYIRFLKDGRSQTRFLSILPLNDCKAETITTSLTTHLRELHLPLDRMCAFGSDGAPVMVGSKNGVAAQLRKLVPHLINNHCVAHRLALAAGQAANGLTYMLKFKDIIGDLYRFYAKSAVRTRGLHEIQELLQEPDLKLVEAKDVRWLSHDKATTTLRRCLPSVYKSLDREAEERNDARAAGLAKFSQNYQFVLTLHMMCDVLPHLSDLSKAMQAKDAIYTCIKPLVLGTLAILQGLLNTPGEHFQAAPDRVARLHADGFGITVPTEEQVQHFTDKLYRPFVQQLMSNIEERFPDLPLLQLFEAYNTTKFPTGDMGNHGEQDIKKLADHFNLPVDATLHNWRQVRGSLQGTEKKAEEAMEWVTIHLRNSHDQLYKLAAVGLLLPTSTADCERGFSTMKRIKTENRSRMKSAVLNALMTVSIEGPDIEAVDFGKMVDAWHQEKPRRTVF